MNDCIDIILICLFIFIFHTGFAERLGLQAEVAGQDGEGPTRSRPAKRVATAVPVQPAGCLGRRVCMIFSQLHTPHITVLVQPTGCFGLRVRVIFSQLHTPHFTFPVQPAGCLGRRVCVIFSQQHTPHITVPVSRSEIFPQS